LLNKKFSFSVKEPVVKTCLRQMGIEHRDRKWYYNAEDFSINAWNEAAIEAEKKAKRLIRELMNYIGKSTQCEELEYDENYYAKSFCDYLINSGAIGNDDLRQLYSGFLVSLDEKSELIDVVSQLKEGTIFFEGIRYCDNPSEIGARWKGNMQLYLDTEILFALSGYNNDLLRDYSQDLMKGVKEINRNCQKEKRIKLKYFESTKNEINYYFDSAIRIVKHLDVLDPTKEAMSQIVNGCRTKSDVETKRSLLFQNLEKYGIELDNENYYREVYSIYNLESQDLEEKYSREWNTPSTYVHASIVQLSNINKIRKGINDSGLENCGAIFVTGTSRTIKLSKTSDFIIEHEVPKATSVDFLINYFWIKSNKGFGVGDIPRTLDMIAQSRFILKGMMLEKLEEQFSWAKDKYEHNEITKEAFAKMNYDIRVKIQSVDDGDISVEDALDDVAKWDFSSTDELINYQNSVSKEKDAKLADFSRTIESQEEALSEMYEENAIKNSLIEEKDTIIEEKNMQLAEKDKRLKAYEEKELRKKNALKLLLKIVTIIVAILFAGLFIYGVIKKSLLAAVVSAIIELISFYALLFNPIKDKLFNKHYDECAN